MQVKHSAMLKFATTMSMPSLDCRAPAWRREGVGWMTHRLLGGDDLAGILAHKLARSQVPCAPEAPTTLLACREGHAQRKQSFPPCRLTRQEPARFQRSATCSKPGAMQRLVLRRACNSATASRAVSDYDPSGTPPLSHREEKGSRAQYVRQSGLMHGGPHLCRRPPAAPGCPW